MKAGDNDGKVDWIRLFPADFLGDTGDLTNEEFGIYARLVLTYYRDHSPLPRSPGRLERIVGAFTDGERTGLLTVLARFFIEDEQDDAPVWRHKRCDKELSNSTTAYQAKVAGAAKAREKRAQILALRSGINSDVRTDDSSDTKSDNPSTTHNPQPTIHNPQPTTHPFPDSLRLSGPDSPPAVAEQGQPPLPDRPKRARAKKNPQDQGTISGPTWLSYSTAYVDRYGVPPTRNAQVNSLLCKFVERVGAEEAPLIAAWFVGHNASWYVTKGHSIAALLADAEKLRTEWATGRQTTQTQARLQDETATRGNVFRDLMNEMYPEGEHDGRIEGHTYDHDSDQPGGHSGDG